MSSTPTSQASTSEVDSQFSTAHNQIKSPTKPPQKPRLSSSKEAAISRDIFLFLIAFRILNALSIKTFFQPDEFFQSLDPAWEIAFGRDSGAWISWVGFPPNMNDDLTVICRSGKMIFVPQSILRFLLGFIGFHRPYQML